MPAHGLFVHQRLRSLPAGFSARVVAPSAWFPGTMDLRPGLRPSLPERELRDGIVVHHPRFPSVPAVLKCLDGVAMAARLAPMLRRLRREFPFDLVDAHFTYPEGVAAALLGRLLRVPVVLTERGTLPLVARARLRRLQARWALRAADRVIAVSESLRADVVALGRPAQRTRVIANGVDAELFAPLDRRAARRELGAWIPELGELAAGGGASAPLLLGVGALSRRKGFDLAIAALRLLEPEHPDARLVIVGGAGAEGAEHDELRALAARLGVAERVVLAGVQPPERLASFYSAADLLLLPSAHEGCPNVVLESIACGTPVVATAVGAIPEILASSGAGVIAAGRSTGAVADAVREALRRRWQRERLRAWSLRRTWATVGVEVAEEMRAAVAASRWRPAHAHLRLAPAPPAVAEPGVAPAAAAAAPPPLPLVGEREAR
jgi:glycosyltransferase involved in cell wall biosynthesis